MPDTLSIWLSAIRPKTLPLACGAIFLGSGLAVFHGHFQPGILILALITAVLLQVISNLANDYGDAVSGADNEQRQGPRRVMQAGLVTQVQMKKAIALASGLAVVSGLALLFTAFGQNWQAILGFIGLGLLAIIAAITYTMGKSPYGYRGLGDISVFLFFGLLGVLGSYYLYSQSLSWVLMLPAASCGLLSAAVLNINNTRDIKTDKAAGKITLAVRLGRQRACFYQWGLIFSALLCTLAFIDTQAFSWPIWLFLFTLVPLFSGATKLAHSEQAEVLNQQLKRTALSSFFYCLLLGLGLVLNT